MRWTTRSDLTAQLNKLWNSGKMLSAAVTGRSLFPLSLSARGPAAAELPSNMALVQEWIADLEAHSKKRDGAGYLVEYRHVNNRIVGENSLPAAIVVETEDDALCLIGKRKAAALFAATVQKIEAVLPPLLSLAAAKPLEILANAEEFDKYLKICLWLLEHPNPDIYLREIPLAGIDSKFIESRRYFIAAMLDLLLPPEAVNRECPPGKCFSQRYGFKTAPSLVRLRLPKGCGLFPPGVTDVSMTAAEFARTEIPCSHVYVTENLTNFLALPADEESLIIWGAGYGFDSLKDAAWLGARKIYYWGDLDTHGFAILSEFRSHFPDASSIMMDEATLKAHRELCVREEAPASRLPANLTAAEASLCAALLNNEYGDHLRLEQERIGIEWVRRELAKTAAAG